MSNLAPDSPVSHQLMQAFQDLPLWVKQVVYVELGKELVQHFAPESLNSLSPEDTLAFYVPKLTSEGEHVILSKKDDVVQLLKDANQHSTVLDICLKNKWSLETLCGHLFECIQSMWIAPPSSLKAMGTIEYLANHIRLGEYLVKMGRISQSQLDQALRTQQYIKEALQEHSGLANILINLGYISRHDTEGILFLKEESRKSLDGVALFQNLMSR